MQIVRTPGSARAIARTLRRPVGFVPTMGALHEGHLALVDRSKAENASTVVSIFVNPLQFGPQEDFARYPRDFEGDAELLRARGVDVLYAPAPERMYPPGFATSLDAGPAAQGLEGDRRPGHFAGVATVVVKLLHAIEPTSLYLGQKDAQQTAVLRAVVRELDMPTNVVVAPTVRESDGLALSSRNRYLTPEQRRAAPSLSRALRAVAAAVEGGETDPARARAAGLGELLPPLRWDYLEIVDPMTFAPLDPATRPAVVAGVAFAGSTRLLDNVSVTSPAGADPIVTPERLRPSRAGVARSAP